MKLEGHTNGFSLVTENDFEVVVLASWRGRRSTVMLETYKKDTERFGETAHQSGWLRVDFYEELPQSQSISKPEQEEKPVE